MKKERIQNLVYAALFLALGMVLPLLTGQIKEIGDSLLPMHLAVMLCGFICGKEYGFIVGLMLPFLRSFIFGMPPLYPNAIWMALELATYGFVIGLIYKLIKKKNLFNIYISLVTSMIAGRIVWGIAKAVLLGVNGKAFTVKMFLIGGFADALLGIVIQLILIPFIITLINKKRRR